MKKIKLTQGKFALVDDEDFEKVNAYKWCFLRYARRTIYKNGIKKNWFLHWDIIGQPERGFEVDHINQNKLDNRRNNLRIVTHSINQQNKPRGGGVGYTKKQYKGKIYYHAQKGNNGKVIYLGTYSTPELARQAYLNSSKLKRSE